MLHYLRKKKKAIVEIIQALFGTDIYYDNEVLHISAENNTITNTTGYAKVSVTNGAVPVATAKMGTYSADLSGGKYATIDGTRIFNFGAVNFTVEGWIYPTAAVGATVGACIVDARTAGAGFYLARKPSTGVLGVMVNNTTWVASGTTALQNNTWYHFAYSRIGTVGYLFVNGTLEATVTDSTNYSAASATTTLGAATTGTMGGYLDDFRVTKNVGKYKTSFVAPTTESSTQSFSIPEYDPNWSSVLMYHRFNYPVNNTDELGRVFTNTGATYDSSIKKFGTHSLFFDGGANLTSSTAISNFNVSGTDFTAEAWIHPTVLNARAYNTILSTSAWLMYVSNTGFLGWVTQGVAVVVSSGTTVPLNQWSHVAVTRSGTAVTLWLNGVQVGTNASVAAGSYAVGQVQIGASSTAGQHFTGYIDDTRLTKGVCRYPIAFTPMQNTFPVGEKPLPASGDTFWGQTSVLAKFDNAATNVVTGSAMATSGVSFDAATVKFGTHSAKFTTTSSYVSAPLIPFGTNDFTVEGWANATTLTASRVLFSNANTWSGTGGNSWWVGTADTGDTTRIMFNRFGTTNYSVGATLTTGSWFHWAVTRAGGIVRVYVNGVKVIQVIDTVTMSAPTAATASTIGNNTGTLAWNGYIDEVRVTVGVPRYTGESFTVPTAEFASSQATAEYATEYATDPFKANTVAVIDFDRQAIYDKASNLSVINNNVISGLDGFIENGTGYFNGTTSSCTLPANSIDLQSSNFTIEGWIKPTGSHPAFGGIFGTYATANFQSIVVVNEAGVLSVYSTTTSGQWNVFGGSTGISLALNQWQHIAVVRNGATLTVFHNGVPTVLSTPLLSQNSVLFHASTHNPSFGAYGTQRFIGFMDNMRITKAARYTAAFVPTARLTK